jgi:hypothetical protein
VEGGENGLKRALTLGLPFLFLATIALLMAPTAYACTPWKVGGGTFDASIPEKGTDTWYVNNIIIVHYYGGGGNLYGTMQGVWIHDEWDMLHPDWTGPFWGVWDTPQGVTVDGVKGTIHVSYWGTYSAIGFSGQWVIISGTGGLANLRGGGTMWADATGAYYTMKYRFGP